MTYGTPIKKIEKLYEKANEQHVAGIVLYANTSSELFYDEALTDAVKASELEYAFIINAALVKTAAGLCRGVAYNDGSVVVATPAGAFATYTAQAD